MRFISNVLLLLMACALAACGGGGGSSGVNPGAPAFFTTAPSTLTIASGSAQQFAVGGGATPYTAVSSNSGVAVATVSGDTLTLGAVRSGTATITVRDARGSTASVSITVSPDQALFTTANGSIIVGIGAAAARSVTIGGGVAPYTATSGNTAVATATVSGSALTIRGVTAGSTTVTVRDAEGTTTSVAVAVRTEVLNVSPSAYNGFIGDLLYSTITGGTAPYTAISGFADAVEADIGTLNTTNGDFTVSSSGNVLRMRLKQVVSSGSVTVRDALGNSGTVTVTASANTNTISIQPSPLVISNRAESFEITIYGATGTFNLFSSDPAIISVPAMATGLATGTTVTATIEACFLGSPVVEITAVDSTGAMGKATITLAESIDTTGCN